jgi:4-carboxymuconolactone decarboxylase
VAMAVPRFPPIPPDRLTAEQRRIADEIMLGRKSLDGPFNAMLGRPGVADPFQKIGAYLRFASPLPAKLKELAIIVVARYWSAEYEWYVHRRLALEAGLPREAADLIEDGVRPDLAGEEAAFFDFVVSLLTTGFVDDSLFLTIKSRFGEDGVSELIAIVGYYSSVSFFLNSDMTPLPEGAQKMKVLESRAFSDQI